MPVNLSIKVVPDALAAGLRARAAANHRSLQKELMAIIEVAVANPVAYRGREATVVSGMTPHGGGGRRAPGKLSIEEVSKALHVLFPRARTRGPSSTEIIRKMRDERYGKLDASGKAIK